MMTHPNDRDEDELPDWLLGDDEPPAASRPKPPSSPYDELEALDLDLRDEPTPTPGPSKGGLGDLVSDDAKAKAKASAQEAKAAAGRAGQAVSAKAGMASAWLKLKVAEFKANRASKAAERSSEKLQATVKAAEQEAKRKKNLAASKALAASQGQRVELEPDLPDHDEMPRVRAELFTGPSPVIRNLGFAVLGLGVLGAAWWAWTAFGPDQSTDTPEPAPAVVQETPAAVAPPVPVEPVAPAAEEVVQDLPPPPPMALPPETEFDLPPLPPARAGDAPVVFEEEPVAPTPRAPRPAAANRPTPTATPAPRRPTVAEEEERQLQEQMRKLEEWGSGN